MLRIRLQRIGKTKRPSYRFVVSERAKDTQSGSLEILGHFHPVEKDAPVVLNEERIKYWLSVGAVPSNTVANILMSKGLMEGKKKKKSVRITDKRRAKIEKNRSEKEEKERAKKAAEDEPTILFLDEIDSLVSARTNNIDANKAEEVSQFLQEFNSLELAPNLIVIAATNRPDHLDSAILRS